MKKLFLIIILSIISWSVFPQTKTENVILVLLDGIRWQEVFRGAEPELLNKENGGVENPDALKQRFWHENDNERRKLLMTFFWSVIAKQGQLYGNQDKGNIAKLANKYHFSYPGYSEMIVGFADDEINSNAPKPNQNVSVFEWFHKLPKYKDKVAVFGAWDVVAAIINRERCGFYVNVGIEPVEKGFISERQKLINELKQQLFTPWGTEPYDAITLHSAIEYMKANKPKLVWITFGETDEFAHEGRYDRTLDAVYRSDLMMKALWDFIQNNEHYKNKTTLIITTDHGRGDPPTNWRHHGTAYPGSDNIWIAVIGPDTPPLGEVTIQQQLTLSQIPATISALLREKYQESDKRIAHPIQTVYQKQK